MSVFQSQFIICSICFRRPQISNYINLGLIWFTKIGQAEEKFDTTKIALLSKPGQRQTEFLMLFQEIMK